MGSPQDIWLSIGQHARGNNTYPYEHQKEQHSNRKNHSKVVNGARQQSWL